MSAAPEWWLGHADELKRARAEGGRAYLEFLRSGALSAGIYALPAGADDPQRPHGQDEVYVVWSGSATLEVEGQTRPVRAGSVAFVAAGVPHRFRDITSDLSVLVFFAPPESEGE